MLIEIFSSHPKHNTQLIGVALEVLINVRGFFDEMRLRLLVFVSCIDLFKYRKYLDIDVGANIGCGSLIPLCTDLNTNQNIS